MVTIRKDLERSGRSTMSTVTWIGRQEPRKVKRDSNPANIWTGYLPLHQAPRIWTQYYHQHWT